MDPFSAEGELINLHNHFHQGQYAECVSYDTSTLSPENALPASVLQLRAQLALGQVKEVLAATKGKKEVELQALSALAEYRSGKTENAVKKIESLVVGDEEMKNPTCLVVAGTVLAGEGRHEEALAVLGRHEGSLECVALMVQCYLVLNRNDLAVKEVLSAKRWGQDSLLVNLAEAWVGMRLVCSSHPPPLPPPFILFLFLLFCLLS
jgi:coatomer protein complex subunit epsilon